MFDGLNSSLLNCAGMHLQQHTVDMFKLPAAKLRENLVSLTITNATHTTDPATAVSPQHKSCSSSQRNNSRSQRDNSSSQRDNSSSQRNNSSSQRDNRQRSRAV